mgnify:CR=1 FL=1
MEQAIQHGADIIIRDWVRLRAGERILIVSSQKYAVEVAAMQQAAQAVGSVADVLMLDDLHDDSYTQDCADRRAHSCSVFQMNNAGFHAEITLEKQNLVFFSVPYDDGFTAYVNGEKADILRVDEGLMAVLCPAGASSIDFVYQAAGLSASRVVTAVAIPVWVVYVAYFVRRKRRSTGAPAEE